MSDWPWVIVSYALTWLVLGLYTFHILRRLAKARLELREELNRTDGSNEVTT